MLMVNNVVATGESSADINFSFKKILVTLKKVKKKSSVSEVVDD